MFTIDKFDGDYRWLSNFYPTEVTYEDIKYPTVENAYQAAKTLDIQQRVPFEIMTPSGAKAAGRALVMRKDWNSVKLHVMNQLVFQKFMFNEDLKEKLMETENDMIVEGNTWNDTFWGVCEGEGENHLGQLIMQTRNMIRAFGY